MTDRGPYLQTFTARAWYPFSPRPADVHLPDLAHQLALANRWRGITRVPYSVAEHCVRAAFLVEHKMRAGKPRITWQSVDHARLALAALLHDAPEAYTSDHATPLKRTPAFDEIREIERRAHFAINGWAGLPAHAHEHDLVKWADRVMLATERRDLIAPMQWDHEPTEAPLPERIEPKGWERAERAFLRTFARLHAEARLPVGATHFHLCVRCFVKEACAMNCAVHTDDDLVPVGEHLTCADCPAREVPLDEGGAT